MCSYLGDMMASISPHERSPNNPALYRILTREFDEDNRTVGSKIVLTAARHVAAAYESHKQRNDGGDTPRFGDESFLC